MEKFKKYLRRGILIIFILLAATGVGLFGAPLMGNRQVQHETRPKIEMVQKEENQEDEDENEDEEKV